MSGSRFLDNGCGNPDCPMCGKFEAKRTEQPKETAREQERRMTGELLPGLVERVGLAIEKSELGYHMALVRLVDDESTYKLTYDDGETLELGSTDEVYLHIAARRAKSRATAALQALTADDLRALLDLRDHPASAA